jgi:hypothetical protein
LKTDLTVFVKIEFRQSTLYITVKKQAIKLVCETWLFNNLKKTIFHPYIVLISFYLRITRLQRGDRFFTGFPRLGPVSSRRRRLVALMLMMAAIYVWSHTLKNRTNRGKAS